MRKLLVLILVMLLLFTNSIIVAAEELAGNLESQSMDIMEAPILDTEVETTTASGITYKWAHGFWLSFEMDGFCLGKSAEKISFWMQDAPSDLCIQIRTIEEKSGTLGNSIYEIAESDLRTGICGKRSKACKANLGNDYYTINLKVKDMPLLKDGKTYAIVIIAGDEIISFDGEYPAILTFTISNDVQYMRENIKMELQRCGADKIPKYNRCNFRK